jgi:hypothetical protein
MCTVGYFFPRPFYLNIFPLISEKKINREGKK